VDRTEPFPGGAASFDRIDRLLLAVLLPALLATLVLFWTAEGGDPPFYAAPPAHADEYPTVGGIRPGARDLTLEVRLGDRLLAVNDVDLRGQGYFDFHAVFLNEALARGGAQVVYERAGQRHEARVPVRARQRPGAPRFIPALAWTLAGLIVLLRAPVARERRLFFAMALAFMIVQLRFPGESMLRTYASLYVFNFGSWIAIALSFLFYIGFPRELPAEARLSPWWASLAGLHLVVRLMYVLPGPWPPHWVGPLAQAVDALFFAFAIAVVSWNYAHSPPAGRRRLKWVILGVYLGLVPAIATMAAGIFGGPPMAGLYDALFVAMLFGTTLMPVGVLIGIVASSLFDIDRIVTATATYSLLGVSLLAATLIAVPRLGGAIGTSLEVDADLAQALVALGLALLLLPFYRRLRSLVERVFFPERRALERGLGELLERLTGADHGAELVALAADRLHELLRPRSCTVLVRGARGFEPTFVRGSARPPPVEADDPLVAILERQTAPLSARGGAPTPLHRAVLETLEAAVVVPLRQRSRLVALLCLGPRRSGDPYTASDVAMLDALARSISVELDRLHPHALARETGAMQAERPAVAPLPAGATLAGAGPGDIEPLGLPETSFEGVVRRAAQAVVLVRGEGSTAYGSGFVAGDGLVLTCDHVLGDAPRRVTVGLQDGGTVEGLVEAQSPERDLALIRVPGGRLPQLPLGRSGELSLGASVVAIGSPGSSFGLLDRTVTRGIVSGHRRLAGPRPDAPALRYVQTDAALNPGSSGGPLLNARGQAVGIVTKKDLDPDREGLSFALAIEEALDAFPALWGAAS